MSTARDDILEAAKDLLWTFGYSATSPRMVLDGSGTGKGSLYHHFKDKKDLAKVALAEMADEHRRRFDQAIGSAGTIEEKVERYLSAVPDVLRGCPMGRMAGDAALIAESDLRRLVVGYFEHLHRGLTRLLEGARKRGEIAPHCDCGAIAAALISCKQGGYVLSRLRQDPGQMQAATDGILELFRALISRSG